MRPYKFCVDCKHFDAPVHTYGPFPAPPSWEIPRCSFDARVNLVFGKILREEMTPAAEMRSESGRCGPEGKIYDPKPMEPAGVLIVPTRTWWASIIEWFKVRW